nr:RHS repeat-associated core domain-containing protein [Marinifilum caeruleilacunae]
MVYDEYKKLHISYNLLNLPDTIKAENGKIVNQYLADGTLLRRSYFDEDENEVKRIDYQGEFLFVNDKLNKIFTEEGYYQPTAATKTKKSDYGTYYYTLKDHLGHTRVVVDEEENVIQETAYYPYGGIIAELSSKTKYNYLYTGKEFIDSLGINWYDHHARYYDPEVGRWFAIDPALQASSPYLAMGNNPMMMVDEDGMTWGIFKAIGNAWDWAWDKGNQFAKWAQQNGIPDASFGVGMNSGGQVNPLVNVNGQKVDFNYGNINTGINQAHNSLAGQLASLPSQKSNYRSLGRAWIPDIHVDLAILNGFLDGEYNFHNYTLEMIIRGMRGPIKNSNGVAHTIRAYQPNFWAEVRDDNGFLGRAGYQIADEVNIVGQRVVLQRLPSRITHLDNSGVNRTEIVDAGIGTMSNFLPASKIGRQLNIAKSTFSVGFFNSAYKGTGIYASKKGGLYLRQFNNVVKQNIGMERAYDYANYMGYVPYFFTERQE